MRFNKGLWTDGEPIDNPNGTWRDARNILLGEKAGAITNELGIIEFGDPLTTGYPSGIIMPIGTIPINNESIVMFSVDIAQTETISEIGILNVNGIYNKKLSDPLLGFKSGFPISGIYKYNFDEELIIAFTDNNTPSKLLNLDNLPFAIDLTTKAILEVDKATLMNMFSDVIFPKIDNITANDSGGTLTTGVYYASFSYELPDTALTNWSEVTNPISIVDDVITTKFGEYNGAVANTTTSKSITFFLKEVDTRYTFIHLAIIKKINGIQTQFEIGKTRITSKNLTIEYSGNETNKSISLNDLLVARPIFIKMKSFTSIDRQLYAGNVEKPQRVNYQKYANNIKVEWIYEDGVTISSDEYLVSGIGEGIEGSYKSNNLIFNKKGFMPDEVYALYIKLNLINGGKETLAYHIPGRAPISSMTQGDYIGVNELSLISNISGTFPELTHDESIDPNIKLFHTRGTATQNGANAFGDMGYWENADEIYPTVEDSEIWDVDGIGVGSKIDDLGNKNVRHHKFPSIRQLTDFGFPYITDSAGTGGGSPIGTITQSGVSIIENVTFTTVNYFLYFSTGSVTAGGTLNAHPLEPTALNVLYEATQDQDVTLIFTNLKMISVSGNFATILFSLEKRDSSNSIISTIVSNNVSGIGVFSEINSTYNISLNSGEKILINGTAISGSSGAIGISGTVTASSSVTGTILTGNRFSKILGLKLSNIKFPIEIRDRITGYEIMYADRTSKNATVLGMSALFHYKYEEGLFVNDKFRTHPFDMLKNKISEVPSYLTNNCIMSVTTPQSDFDINTLISPTAGNFTSPIKDSYIRRISTSKYLPFNNVASDPDNEKREECLYGELDFVLGSIGTAIYLTSMNSFKRNIYNIFTEQKLITTGSLNFINTSSFSYLIAKQYGGDNYISTYTYRLCSEAGKGGASFTRWNNIICPVHSVSNIGFRNEGIDWWDVLRNNTANYRISTIFIENIPVGTIDNDGNEVGNGGSATTAQKQSYLKEFNNAFGYNTDYSSNNDNTVNVPYDSTIEINEKQHYDIVRTPISDTEEVDDSWRIFLESDRFTMGRNRGVLWNLKSKKDQLIIQMEESSFITLGATKLPTSEIDVTIGTGDIFKLRPRELLTTENGYSGTHSQYGNILTKYGLVIPDETNGKIFILSDKLIEISEAGKRNYFRDNLSLKLSKQLTRLLGFSHVVDNPYAEAGIIAVHDERFDRIIITKRDYEIKSENEQYFKGLFDVNGTYSVTSGGGTYQPRSIVIKDGLLQHIAFDDLNPTISSWLMLSKFSSLIDDHSFTVSYTPDIGLDNRGAWIGFHDYIPRAFFYTKNNFYSFDTKLYIHNDLNSRCKFYNGVVFDHFIDASFNQSPNASKMYFNSNWRSELFDNNTLDRLNTFDTIQLINSYQDTGIISLSVFQDLKSLNYNVRNEKNTWNFNKMRDNDADFYNKRRLIDKYLRIIFTYKNLDNPQKVLYLYEANVKMRLAERGIRI